MPSVRGARRKQITYFQNKSFAEAWREKFSCPRNVLFTK
jgi:hypothetical protein